MVQQQVISFHVYDDLIRISCAATDLTTQQGKLHYDSLTSTSNISEAEFNKND